MLREVGNPIMSVRIKIYENGEATISVILSIIVPEKVSIVRLKIKH